MRIEWQPVHRGCNGILELHVERSAVAIKGYSVVAKCSCLAERVRISKFYQSLADAEAELRDKEEGRQ